LPGWVDFILVPDFRHVGGYFRQAQKYRLGFHMPYK